jgi:predicted dehydrogenase
MESTVRTPPSPLPITDYQPNPALEAIQSVLGPLASYTPLLTTSFPEPKVTDAGGAPTGATSTRTSHDQLLLHGTLASGAVLSYHLRGGPAFSNSPSAGAFWRIYGTEGEIQLTGPESYLQIAEDNVKIEVFVHKTGQTETVAVETDEWSELMIYGRNVARLYDAVAEGKGADGGVLSWADAVERHKFVEDVYAKVGVN